VHTGRIDQNYLPGIAAFSLGQMNNSLDAVARGLSLGEIIASFSPTSAFSIVDLPALGRPRMQTKPERNGIGN